MKDKQTKGKKEREESPKTLSLYPKISEQGQLSSEEERPRGTKGLGSLHSQLKQESGPITGVLDHLCISAKRATRM